MEIEICFPTSFSLPIVSLGSRNKLPTSDARDLTLKPPSLQNPSSSSITRITANERYPTTICDDSPRKIVRKCCSNEGASASGPEYGRNSNSNNFVNEYSKPASG